MSLNEQAQRLLSLNADTTHYDVLGVSVDATFTQIRKAYYKKSLLFHPDRNPEGEEAFKAIGNAWDVLQDPDNKRQYDAHLKHGMGDFSSPNEFKGAFAAMAEELRAQMTELLKKFTEDDDTLKDITLVAIKMLLSKTRADGVSYFDVLTQDGHDLTEKDYIFINDQLRYNLSFVVSQLCHGTKIGYDTKNRRYKAAELARFVGQYLSDDKLSQVCEQLSQFEEFYDEQAQANIVKAIAEGKETFNANVWDLDLIPFSDNTQANTQGNFAYALNAYQLERQKGKHEPSEEITPIDIHNVKKEYNQYLKASFSVKVQKTIDKFHQRIEKILTQTASGDLKALKLEDKRTIAKYVSLTLLFANLESDTHNNVADVIEQWQDKHMSLDLVKETLRLDETIDQEQREALFNLGDKKFYDPSDNEATLFQCATRHRKGVLGTNFFIRTKSWMNLYQSDTTDMIDNFKERYSAEKQFEDIPEGRRPDDHGIEGLTKLK